MATESTAQTVVAGEDFLPPQSVPLMDKAGGCGERLTHDVQPAKCDSQLNSYANCRRLLPYYPEYQVCTEPPTQEGGYWYQLCDWKF
jgi:hypothetical protein